MLIPLGGQCTFEQCRQLGELLARVIVPRLPDIATTSVHPATAAAASTSTSCRTATASCSSRPSASARCRARRCRRRSLWDEVDDGLDPRAFTIRTVPGRMQAFGRDPLSPVLTQQPDLQTALSRLAARLG